MPQMTEPQEWRDLAAYVTLRRAVSSQIEPSGSIDAGKTILSKWGLPTVFSMIGQAVAQEDEVKISIGSEGLQYLLSSQDVLNSISADTDLTSSLIAALSSGSAAVEKLALSFLRDIAVTRVQCPALPRSRLFSIELLQAVMAQLRHGEEQISVADAAADLLCAAAGARVRLHSGSLRSNKPVWSRTPAPTAAELGVLVQQVKGLASAPDVSAQGDTAVFSRLLSLVARICGIGDAAFEACESAGLVRVLLDTACDTSDPLVQMIVVDLLPPLAGSARGAAALLSSGAYETLLTMSGVPAASTDPNQPQGNSTDALDAYDSLVGNNALTAVAEAYAAAVKGSGSTANEVQEMKRLLVPGLFRVLHHACDNALSDFSRAASALASIGAVASADVTVLHELMSQKWEGAVKEWLGLGASSQGELRLASLSTLARLLHAASRDRRRATEEPVPSPSNDGAGAAAGGSGSSSSTTSPDQLSPEDLGVYCRLFDLLGPCCGSGRDSTDILKSCLTNPADPDARYAAYDVLVAVVAIPGTWGLRRVFGAPGMASMLLDRNQESTKTGREWRFSVLETAVLHPQAAALGDDLLGRLQAWVGRGPYAADMSGPAVTHMTL